MKRWLPRLSKISTPQREPVADWKQAALADFKQWLDELEVMPTMPDESAETRYGLLDIVDALTAVRTETGNLARQATRALREHEEQQKAIAAEREQEAAARAAERQELKRAVAVVEGLPHLQDADRERAERRRVLQILFDTAADLRAVQERAVAPPLPRRWFKRPAAAVPDGKDIGLLIKGIEAALATWKVRELAAEGDPFDPRTMRAVASTETGRVPPGTVCDVIRQGIVIDEQVERYAEVNVEREDV